MIFFLSFYCSGKRGQNRRLGHDWNWAMRYLEMSSSRSLRLSVTKPHHAYVSLPRQPYRQEKYPITIIEVPTYCASISRQFWDKGAMQLLPLIRRLSSTHEGLYLMQHSVLASHAVAMPRVPVSGRAGVMAIDVPQHPPLAELPLPYCVCLVVVFLQMAGLALYHLAAPGV